MGNIMATKEKAGKHEGKGIPIFLTRGAFSRQPGSKPKGRSQAEPVFFGGPTRLCRHLDH